MEEERTMMQKEPTSREEVLDRSGERPQFSPSVDIYDQGDEIVLVADMPGVSGDSIDVHLDRGVLTIRGRVRPEGDQGQLIYEEYQVGDFVRTFTLTEDIDTNGISAELSNGVLSLRLPKAQEKKARKIQVRAG